MLPLNSLEIESQYYLENKAALNRVAAGLPTLQDPRKEQRIVRTDIFLRSRPISAYLDTDDFRLCRKEICLRTRFKGNDGIYPASASAKILLKNQNQRSLTRRIETEVSTTNEAFSYFNPRVCNFFDEENENWCKVVEKELGNAPLVPVFATASNRIICGLNVLVGDEVSTAAIVHMELALDDCSYYLLSPDTKLWVPKKAPPEEKHVALLMNQEDITSTGIRGIFLCDQPQLEIEFKPDLSDKGVGLKEIGAAETATRRFLQRIFNLRLESKLSKSQESVIFIDNYRKKSWDHIPLHKRTEFARNLARIA